MQLPGKRISESDSLSISSHPTAEVSFSDNSTATCLVVACLDEEPALIRNAVAKFVRECQRIRDHYSWGVEVASEEAAVELAEAGEEDEGNPESEGTYVTPPRSAVTVKRRHGSVWKTLKLALAKGGVNSTNKRVGRFGPDLRTLKPQRILFEIKTTIYAAAVQQALGQLLLYEQTLGAPHIKILVLPHGLSITMREAIKALDILVVEYRWVGKSAVLDKQALDKVLAARGR
ncbi:hypothetical protein SAMN05216289_11347 [Dokdonella immobilis]|uniref:Uncharacterized protein n=2 Tax=Dokdonella immobilis TaxID=578942 RepID=A0A1I4XYP6_9GAMM|nr:hypothetical protein SAMN05216289_11347 [Dokdonella immobilis]